MGLGTAGSLRQGKPPCPLLAAPVRSTCTAYCRSSVHNCWKVSSSRNLKPASVIPVWGRGGEGCPRIPGRVAWGSQRCRRPVHGAALPLTGRVLRTVPRHQPQSDQEAGHIQVPGFAERRRDAAGRSDQKQEDVLVGGKQGKRKSGGKGWAGGQKLGRPVRRGTRTLHQRTSHRFSA